MIRYAKILLESVVDGPGIRIVAFLQGCVRHCEGCHNPELLPMAGGNEIGEREFAEFLLSKVNGLHRGITFSGGDPLAQADALTKVISVIKQKKPQLNIWVYTGFTFEAVKHLPVMKLIDVLVDGPFVMAERDLSLAFRGSSNQRIIDVKTSLALNRAVEISIDYEAKVG